MGAIGLIRLTDSCGKGGVVASCGKGGVVASCGKGGDVASCGKGGVVASSPLATWCSLPSASSYNSPPTEHPLNAILFSVNVPVLSQNRCWIWVIYIYIYLCVYVLFI